MVELHQPTPNPPQTEEKPSPSNAPPPADTTPSDSSSQTAISPPATTHVNPTPVAPTTQPDQTSVDPVKPVTEEVPITDAPTSSSYTEASSSSAQPFFWGTALEESFGDWLRGVLIQ